MAATPRYVGETVETKTTHSWKLLVAGLVVACLWLGGCGGGGAANVVSVSVGDSLGGVVVVTQADTITALVTGPTAPTGGTADLNVAFTCTFTTTTTTGTTTTTNPKQDCTAANGAIGTISNVQPTTEIFTAPAELPDQTKFQGLIITITATSDFDKSKSGTVLLRLESGILVTVTPAAATLALGETKQFTATLTTDNTPNDVTWGVTNTTVNTGGTPSIAGTFTLTTPTCTSTTPADNCGSIDQTGKFSAPTGTTLPTNTNVIVFAIAKKDTTRVAIANIILVTGGSITFNSLWPTIVPQGGSQADVFLNATNLTSQIGLSLKFTAADGTTTTKSIDAGSNALKVFFTPSTFGATAGPVSTGARLRLTPDQLAKVGTYTVTITPGNPAEQTGTITPHTFTVLPVRPGLVASNPANISQGSTSQAIAVDGGYYGPSEAPNVGINFNGSNVANPSPVGVDPRRLTGHIMPSGLPGGLFPLSVANTLQADDVGVAYSNISILPSYANASVLSSLPHDTTGRTFPPCTPSATCVADSNGNSPFQLCTGCTPPLPIPLGATTKPSAIALDPILGYAAVAEAGTNMVQLINLTTTTPTLGASFSTRGTVPTGIAIDHADCTTGAAGVCSVTQPIVAVVNYESQTLTVFTIPGGTFLESIDLSKLIPPSEPTGTNSNPSPNPYSVGIDPFTHRALVAFASTNAGFVVNLDQSQSPSICLPGFAPSDGTSYCPVAYADLNTGSNPQIAFEPGAHLAFVTPGGVGGTLTAVNLSNPAQAPLKILSATRTANVVTVTMEPNTPHNLVPGSTATVLISGLPLGSGLPPTNAHTSFNGAFPLLSVINNLEFTYVQTGDNDATTSTVGQQGFLSAGNNALTFSVTPTIQGIDINPITHSAVLADPNASGSQITFLNSLDENVTSLNLCIGRNLAILTNPLPCGPELGTTAVAFQPFTNTVVSLNSSLNQLSLLDPSADQRVTIVQTGQMAASSICFPASSCATTPPGAGAITVNLNGAIAVDPLLNLALAVNSGSGNITPLYLGTIKPLQIESVSTPPVDAADATIVTPAIIAQSVLIKSTKLPQTIGGIQIFGTGFSGSSQVRLDGVALPPSDVVFSSAKPNELDITVPATNGSQNILTGPRNFGLDVANPDGSTSNVMDFRVVEAIPILPSAPCTAVKAVPGAVAIADDLLGTTKNYAVVTETACSAAAVISLNPLDGTFASVTTIATGGTPTGVATIPRYGYAVVSNNADGTVSILDLSKKAQVVANVTVGTNPTGVAIEQETGLAVIANTGSNTATVIDLTPLQATTPGTLVPLTVATDQEPIAVAIDPDRGANATGLAVVTTLNISANPAQGALDSVDISLAVPAKNALATASVGSIPTGIIFDPASNPRLFYAVESNSNAFISFNPDAGSASSIPVGINPTSIAYNFQTSTILTVNSASNTISVVDAQTFQIKATLGIGGVSFFSAAIEPFLNLAVIADQSNNRVLLFPLPH